MSAGGDEQADAAADIPDRIFIEAATLVDADGVRSGVDVLIDAGVIHTITEGLTHERHMLRARDLVVTPGFIDLHVHGGGGDLFEHASVDGNARISMLLARYGTTACMATLATLPADALREAVAAIAALRGREPGARIAGIHLEGPYLNPQYCGAQNPAWMRAPSLDEVDALQRIAGGSIRMVTVAPELEGAIPFIRALRDRGVVVAMGHTNATTAEVDAAVAAGVTHVTHLFNAMRGLHHREPGPTGVALTNDALTVELVCDGHHVSPRVIDLVFRCKPRGSIALVTDAVAAGLPDGEHELFSVPCVVRGGTVRTGMGQLAGSCLTLDAGVRNLRSWQPQRGLDGTVACVSTVPTRIAGLSPRTTDHVILTSAMRVAATVVRGRCVSVDTGTLVAQGQS